MAKGLKDLTLDVALDVLSSSNRNVALLNSISWLGYEKQIKDEVNNSEALASIGTDNQMIDIDNKTAATIRKILDISTQEKEGKIIPFVGNCAKAAVEAMGIEYDESKTMGDYLLDYYKVAGIVTQKAVEVTESMLGTVRGNLGAEYQYAKATKEAIEKAKEPVVALFVDGHVATVSTIKDIEMEESKGCEYSGIVLAKGEMEGFEYLNKGIENILNERVKGNKIGEKEKEILGAIINGVSAPEEFNKVMEYVFAIWDKDMNKMLSYIGLTKENIEGKGTEQIVQTIVKASTNKMAEAVDLCKAGKISEKEVEVEIKLVSGLRDLLITASQQENADNFLTESNDAIKAKLIVNKAVNQNIIVNMFEKTVNDSAVNTDDSDFVIDVKKLQSAVVDKTIKFAKDANIDSVMDILKDAKSDRFRTPLMRLSDIHAVAASA